jgi:hypothetical protein
LTPESPVVGTGIEAEVAKNTISAVLAEAAEKSFVPTVTKFTLNTKMA